MDKSLIEHSPPGQPGDQIHGLRVAGVGHVDLLGVADYPFLQRVQALLIPQPHVGAWVPAELALSPKDVASMHVVTFKLLDAKALAWGLATEVFRAAACLLGCVSDSERSSRGGAQQGCNG